MLVDLMPSELAHVEILKYEMSQERDCEVPIEEVIDLFFQDIAERRLQRDNLEQFEEALKYKLITSQQQGKDRGDAAIIEWIHQYAPIWRAERESLEKNGFLSQDIVIINPDDLPINPWSTIASISIDYFCDIFVHRLNKPLPQSSFILKGKDYVNVRSLPEISPPMIEHKDHLEFISLGDRSHEALDAIMYSINYKELL